VTESRVEKAQSFACKLRLLTRELTRFVTEALESYGVTPSQADFLYHLSNGETQPSVIAQHTGVDPSNLSRMIRQFEERGWLIRHIDKSNRTRVTLELTSSGQEIVTAIDPHAAFVQCIISKVVTPTQLHEFGKIMDKVGTALAETSPTQWQNDSKDK